MVDFKLKYEVWYQYGPNKIRVAAFHKKHEAEKYLKALHPNDSHYKIEESAE